MMKKCPKCKSTEIDKGILKDHYGVGYGSLTKKFSFKRCPVIVFTCIKCGYCELYTDVERLPG